MLTFFFFNDTATTEIYTYCHTLSLHDALPIFTAFGGLPFTLFNAQEDRRREYLSDELHLIGDFGDFNFIAGLYYNKDQSYGPSGTQFTAFSVGGTPAAPVTSHVTNENKAVFAQIGFEDRKSVVAGKRVSVRVDLGGP